MEGQNISIILHNIVMNLEYCLMSTIPLQTIFAQNNAGNNKSRFAKKDIFKIKKCINIFHENLFSLKLRNYGHSLSEFLVKFKH